MPEPSKKFSPGTRVLGVGFELAAAVAGFTLLGYWFDRHFGHAPWGVLTGVVLGLVGGMYNLIRASLGAAREATREAHEAHEDAETHQEPGNGDRT